MSYVLGLTGSIGMGKSTTSEFFREADVPVWDADAAVHALYDGGAGARAIEALVPDAIKDGGVDRSVLRAAIMAGGTLLKRVEAVIHPLVSADRSAFLESHKDKALVVCDIPLLFETGADKWLDGVLVVTASAEIQAQRVMARTGMTAEVFASILSKQTPDAEKRQRADFVIDTGEGLDHARAAVISLVGRITEVENA